MIETLPSIPEIWEFLSEVEDPEIPVLNVVEMGIVRKAYYDDTKKLWVHITPTYSGCPAMTAIEMDVRAKLFEKGFTDFQVKTDFSEIWTTDWMTDEAQKKLKEYGIAPPKAMPKNAEELGDKIIPCPWCDSLETALESEFGSTACKALFYCHSCHQPFEHFKCI